MWPAVFLDRDGTILEEMGYLNHISRFRMLSGVAAAIRGLNTAQLPVVVVTNQSGVARGWMACIIARMSAPDECDCRKPKTGMLERAASELKLDLKKSFVVGDRSSDVELARRAGAC